VTDGGNSINELISFDEFYEQFLKEAEKDRSLMRDRAENSLNEKFWKVLRVIERDQCLSHKCLFEKLEQGCYRAESSKILATENWI